MVIKCQNCGAMLTQAESGEPIVECEYCHAKLFLGGASVVAQVRAEAKRQSRTGLIVGLVIAAAVIGVLVMRFASGTSSSSSTTKVESEPPAPPPPPPAPVKPPPPPSVGKVVLTFGEEGTNAGQFTGARAFAVMPSGEIVIAEVSTGRVQIFDAKGAYQRLVTVPPSALTKELGMYGVGVDDKGHAIVSRAGDLVVIDVAAGKIDKVIRGSYPDRYYSSDVSVMPDGTIYAVTDRTGDYAITKVTMAGKVLGAVSKTNTRRFAVDGVGTVSLSQGREIEIRNAKGETLKKFSQGNPARGKMQHTDEIAVDGRGHVFVGESDRVTIFDVEGAFVAELATESIADLAVDREGFLYVLSRDKVTKYALTLPR